MSDYSLPVTRTLSGDRGIIFTTCTYVRHGTEDEPPEITTDNRVGARGFFEFSLTRGAIKVGARKEMKKIESKKGGEKIW